MNPFSPLKFLGNPLSNKIVLFGFLTVGWTVGLVGLGWGGWQLYRTRTVDMSIASSVPSAGAVGQVVVELAGAVKLPGLYTAEYGWRWGHVLDKAGGLLPEADLQYFQSNINLANRPKDGDRLYIPFVGEKMEETRTSTEETSAIINLNTATAEALDSLPGIGEKTVAAIVAARPFASIDELVSKKIVGEKVFSEIHQRLAAP